MSTENYNLINILLQVVIGLAMIGTFWVYYGQLQTMKKSGDAQSIMTVMNYLQDSDIRRARHRVIKFLKDDISQWSELDEQAASKVCSSYHLLSVLIKNKVIEKELFLHNWGPSIVKCYKKLEKYINQIQSESTKNQWSGFKELYYDSLEITGIAED